MRNFQFRIYPTKKQARQMNTVLSVCQRLWNYFLNQKIEAYKTSKKSISSFTQIKEIPQLTIKDDILKEVYSQTLQDVPRRLDKSFQAFFRRVKQGDTPGFPRFKAKDRYNSFTYPQNNGSFKFTDDGKLYLSKIGHVKIALHREVKGLMKTCVVKKTPTGKWFVVIAVENEIVKKVNDKPAVGIDLGCKVFAVLSDGSKVKREWFFKKEEDNLAKAQRKLVKQVKGTVKRKQVKKVVTKIHERITNKRKNFTHQLSRKIANKYGVICVEDLNILSMQKNKTITVNGITKSATPTHRSINDVAWNEFVNQLKYKAEEAGSLVILVNPRNTTKECSKCGKLTDKDLSQRVHSCSCGHTEDRDFNASKNILAMGLHSLANQKVA